MNRSDLMITQGSSGIMERSDLQVILFLGRTEYLDIYDRLVSD